MLEVRYEGLRLFECFASLEGIDGLGSSQADRQKPVPGLGPFAVDHSGKQHFESVVRSTGLAAGGGTSVVEWRGFPTRRVWPSDGGAS